MTLHAFFLTYVLLFSIAIDWKVAVTLPEKDGRERMGTRVM
jgi:hypothetical protein